MAGLSDETKDRFAQVVRHAFVERLKPAGFRKVRNTWHRPGGQVVPAIDIQRSWGSTSDLTRFTANWGVHVEGLRRSPSPSTHTALMTGRIGWFGDPRRDRWWQIEAGRLSRWADDEQVTDEETEVEIACLVDAMATFVESIADTDALADLVEAWPDIGLGPVGLVGGDRRELVARLRMKP